MNGFLGQVPLRRVPFMGQQSFPDSQEPWNPSPYAIEDLLSTRKANPPPVVTVGEIRAQEKECDRLKTSLDDAYARYSAPGSTDADYDAYIASYNAWNICESRYEYLQWLSQQSTYPQYEAASAKFQYEPPQGEEPTPLPEPEPPQEPPPVASVQEWPAEVPKPTTEPFTPEEPPYTKPEDCDPLKGQFYDPATRSCRGSVAPGWSRYGGLTTAGGGAYGLTSPATTAVTSAFMGAVPARIPTVPLYRGRF